MKPNNFKILLPKSVQCFEQLFLKKITIRANSRMNKSFQEKSLWVRLLGPKKVMIRTCLLFSSLPFSFIISFHHRMLYFQKQMKFLNGHPPTFKEQSMDNGFI